MCVVSKDIIPLFSYLLHWQPTNNISFLVGDNYGNFHSVHQPENDINYWHFSIYDCATDVRKQINGKPFVCSFKIHNYYFFSS